jgi:hypothetical protein
MLGLMTTRRSRSAPEGSRGTRGAGSKTVLDVLRAWIGRGRDPESDLVDLAGGRTRLVSAFLREKLWRQGVLVLDLSEQSEPIVWGPGRVGLSR